MPYPVCSFCGAKECSLYVTWLPWLSEGRRGRAEPVPVLETMGREIFIVLKLKYVNQALQVLLFTCACKT